MSPRDLPTVPKSAFRRLLPFASAICALVFLSSIQSWAQASCPSPATLLGAWGEQGSANQLRIEPTRVILRENGLLRAATILKSEPCKIVVRDQGVIATWRLQVAESGIPQLDRGKGPVTLDRLAAVPASLNIEPLPLPTPGPLSPELTKDIAAELVAREARDQAAIKSDAAKRPSILDDNIRYLRDVVTRYGWIDIPRFGKGAAAAAILIVKHSSDLPLLQDALPVAERDAKENGGGKELVSILVDDVLISTGHKQKYGTQIAEDEHGKPYVIPVEDLDKVEVYRKELGILSWQEYLKKASQFLYDGQPIRIPGPNE